MAKSKEQKRKEALERLTVRMTERKERGLKPTRSQIIEHDRLVYSKRKLTEAEREMERIFGPGDSVTGIIHADPLPFDFRPTPELEKIVKLLQSKKDHFVELQVGLDTPKGYPYPTYQGSGAYLEQWVARHTDYRFHHAKNLCGSTIVVVFSYGDQLPEYNEHDNLIRGTTKEMYDRL